MSLGYVEKRTKAKVGDLASLSFRFTNDTNSRAGAVLYRYMRVRKRRIGKKKQEAQGKFRKGSRPEMVSILVVPFSWSLFH